MYKVVILLALTGLSCGKEAKKIEAPPPNVVFILADDLGWTDLGFMGSSYYETPNLDRLSSQGMTFSRAYSNAPNCAPTRASLMSGVYTPSHGVITVASSERGKSEDRKLIPIPNKLTLDSDYKTMAEVFFEAGYRTGHVGKWHLGMEKNSPQKQGFEYSIPGWEGDHKRTFYSPGGTYLTDSLTTHAIEFISEAKNDDRPFFLYMAFHTVHTPIQPRADLLDRFEGKEGDDRHNNPKYAAMVASLDESVGRILMSLQEHDLEGETMVVFMSDNGGHATYTLNTPLRGSKGMLYEGGVRVPLVVKWPGKIEAGSRSEEPVITLDFLPSFLELTNSKWEEEYPLHGESLLTHFQTKNSLKREYLYWHFPAYLEIYRRLPGKWRITPMGSIVKGDWKLMQFFENDRIELYNLATDLGEESNVAIENPKIVDELLNEMESWREELGARVPSQLNPEFVKSES